MSKSTKLVTRIMAVCLALIAVHSCRNKMDCEFQKAEAEITDVTFSGFYMMDEEIPLYVQIKHLPYTCLHEVNANLEQIGIDSFRIVAELEYTPIDECPCPDIYYFGDVVFFKASRPGQYYFTYGNAGSTSSSSKSFVLEF